MVRTMFRQSTSPTTEHPKYHVLILLLGLLTLLSACSNREYPKPTDGYYANDFAEILYGATLEQIISEGEMLYDDTEDLEDGGAQIVIATFEVENTDAIASYDKTELFREWEIGQNDMGILVILFFVGETIDGIDYLVLEETQIETGYRMEQYVTPTRLGDILDTTLYSDTCEDLDSAVMAMTYELIRTIRLEAYGDDTYVYDMELFQTYVAMYPDGQTMDDEIESGLFYLVLALLSGGDIWSWIVGGLVFVAFSGGTTFFVKNKGGGGSSGGMGIFRRRR
jgi:uncharacterized protein